MARTNIYKCINKNNYLRHTISKNAITANAELLVLSLKKRVHPGNTKTLFCLNRRFNKFSSSIYRNGGSRLASSEFYFTDEFFSIIRLIQFYGFSVAAGVGVIVAADVGVIVAVGVTVGVEDITGFGVIDGVGVAIRSGNRINGSVDL